MKNIFIKALAGVMLTVGASSCGDKFLETDIYNGTDIETILGTSDGIDVALNGAYYRLSQYYFAGNYATSLGDIISDISYWNGSTGHFNAIYSATYTDTDSYLSNSWIYGYKVIDNASRVLKAADVLLAQATGSEASNLQRCKAEAYALRAYAMFYLTNAFGHQVKVNGQDYSNELGVVVVNEPIEAFAEVARNTVGECYSQIISDLNASLAAFQTAGKYSRTGLVFNPASVNGLMARVKLYMEDFDGAISAATQALSLAGIDKLTYTEDGYEDLYGATWSNAESLFFLALDDKTSWSANSCGTLWTTYSFSPSPYLVSLYADTDVRTAIMYWTNEGGTKYANYGATTPWYGGGKFGAGNFDQITGGNPSTQTNYLINAPEMFLIQAEANIRKASADEAAAKTALLTVAKRNTAITSVSDLPSGKDAIMSFIRDERARELFQEGHRFWDMRRWGVPTNLYAFNAPEIEYSIENCVVSDVIFPIPQGEINAGFGVTQTPNWSATRPK